MDSLGSCVFSKFAKETHGMAAIIVHCQQARQMAVDQSTNLWSLHVILDCGLIG